MSESLSSSDTSLPSAQLVTTRELVHDLSNALEIIVQSSFLLSTLDLGENGKEWHQLLEAGLDKATIITKKLRETLRKQM